MVIYVMNDIFDGTPNNCIIVQSVNCKGKMGKGLAKAIRDRYPVVYEQYMAEHKLGLLKLGYVSYVPVEQDILVANMCGQDGYGSGRRYTDYDALKNCLEDVKMMAEALDSHVVIPYKLGCGNGGGDWKVVSDIINEVFRGELVAFVYQEGDEELYENSDRRVSREKNKAEFGVNDDW